MLDAENIFQFKLTLTDSFPEVWRRILVPDECTLGDLHYVISYSFCWFQDSEHEFSQGSRLFGPKGNRAPGKLEDEHEVFHNADAWNALCAKLGPCDWQLGFEPTYLGIGDINGSLNFIFRTSEPAQAPV
jgi:hypothetical protein